jgi:cardiolipin synthase A/B
MSRQGVGISLLPYLTVVSYWPGVVAHRQPARTGAKPPFVMEETDFSMNFIVAVLLAAVALLGIAIWSIKRHKDPHLELDTDAPLDKLVASLSGMALGMPMPGNAVEIFENGAFFEALLQDIAAAQRSVHFETFLWKEGVLGQRLATAFAKAARKGVQVRLVLDALGCKKMGKAARQKMDDAGCRIAIYHPRTLRNIGVIAERDHRKLTVLDGRIAWVGGHCIVDEWLGDAQDRHHVRDLSVRLRGPIVHAVQSVFSENWVEVTGKLFVGTDVFPPPEKAGDVVAHVASVKPEGSAPAVKILHHAVLCCAKNRIRIQNPYFIPEPDAVDAFAAAVKRGVDVRVMVPSTEVSDQRRDHRRLPRRGAGAPAAGDLRSRPASLHRAHVERLESARLLASAAGQRALSLQ